MGVYMQQQHRLGQPALAAEPQSRERTMDPWRDLGRHEALAGVPDRSRLPRTIHGIGVQLHSSAAASGFGNSTDAAERTRSPSS